MGFLPPIPQLPFQSEVNEPIVHWTEWKSYRWFPWLEYRHHYFLGITERRWRQPKPIIIPPPIELPSRLLFDWHRDYGPLWEPGSTAFWLAPEPGDLPAGVWPLPFIKPAPLQPHTRIDEVTTHLWDVGVKVVEVRITRFGT